MIKRCIIDSYNMEGNREGSVTDTSFRRNFTQQRFLQAGSGNQCDTSLCLVACSETQLTA